MQRQSGFTLIELVVVIVILGILAATAVPKFVNLENEAAKASTEALAGNLESAAAIDWAKSKVNSTYSYNVSACSDTSNLIKNGLPTGASVGGASLSNCWVAYEGYNSTFNVSF